MYTLILTISQFQTQYLMMS